MGSVRHRCPQYGTQPLTQPKKRMSTLANIKVGSSVEALFHRSASADLRNAKDRDERSKNGQFDSIKGVVTSVKEVSTGIQVCIKRTDGDAKPYGSLTSNQKITKLVVNGEVLV
jgi:hypothetical protein